MFIALLLFPALAQDTEPVPEEEAPTTETSEEAPTSAPPGAEPTSQALEDGAPEAGDTTDSETPPNEAGTDATKEAPDSAVEGPETTPEGSKPEENPATGPAPAPPAPDTPEPEEAEPTATAQEEAEPEATETEPEAQEEAAAETTAETTGTEATELPNPLQVDTSEFQQANAAATAIAQGEYETLEGLSRRQVRWLKPKRSRLPPNSRATTDFTAYVLEWGEVEFGPTGLSVGALPRFQIGTVPLLDALGLYNGWAKVNPLRLGGFDLALNASAFYLPIKGFEAYLISGGALASVQILEPWSVHVGANYARAHAEGVPDLTTLSPLLANLTGEELAEYGTQALVDDLYIDADAQFATVRLATDYRLNRRDSIIAQAQAMVWASVDTDVDLPPILNMNEALDLQSEGTLALQDAYMVSLAYQAAWRRLTVRAGLGLSSQRGAWLIQTLKINYRFGGETRRNERLTRAEWRGNKDDKTKRRERRRAEERGAWTPDQENESPDSGQGGDSPQESSDQDGA